MKAIAVLSLSCAAALGQHFQLPEVHLPSPSTNTYHIGFSFPLPDNTTDYGVLVFSNELPIRFYGKVVTTVVSNADFVVTNLPERIDAFDFYSVLANGALRFTNALPAVKRLVTVWDSATNFSIQPTNMLWFYTNSTPISVSNFDANSLLRKDP